MLEGQGGPFYTPLWSPADALMLTEVMFLQALYIRAGGSASNVALKSDISGGVAVADITSQFNSSATSFSLPSYSSILLVIFTGWPPNGALEPTVDFTTPDATHIALTGTVSAPASGTTGIILYTPS